MLKKILIGLVAVILIGGGVAWINRESILLTAVKRATVAQHPVAPHHAIDWAQGPAAPASAPSVVWPWRWPAATTRRR